MATFELRLPDSHDQAFSESNAVIDLPDRPIRRLNILVLDSVRRNISISGIRVWINGRGAGNILNSSGVERGLMLTMDPSTLNKRPDELFDPRENTIEILAKDRRDRTYYQSWILRSNGRACLNCPAALRNAFFTYSGSVSRDDPEGVPPEILLEEPRVPPVVQEDQNQAKVTISGTCSSAYRSTSLRLNGQDLAIIPGNSGQFRTAVPVRRDMKELVLEAIDYKHNVRTVVIPLSIKRKQTPRPRFQGKRYALIVGISDYGNFLDAPPPLARARADARELALSLEQSAGFDKNNIRLLIDDQATRAQIRTGFSDFTAQARAGDLLVVYVAAHGLHDPTPGRGNQLFLAPYGTQLKQIDSTAIGLDELETLLSRYARSNHTFVIFDVGHDAGIWKIAGPNLINNHLLNLFSEQEGRAVMVSGSAGEVSRQREGGGQDFNSWLSTGLAGGADLNQDGVVTADELFRYVSENVRQDTGGKQNPRYRLPARSADDPLTPQTPSPPRGILVKPAPDPPGERRLALVIGNGSYASVKPLLNPVHDAEDMKRALERWNFQVAFHANAGLNAMRTGIDKFVGGLKKGDVALFYFAGHGMRIDDVNLLVPVDYPVTTREAEAKDRSISFDELKRNLENSGARLSILVADACRNNPYDSGRSWGNTWSAMEVGLGTYLAFAASPGERAEDNSSERNGLFTKYVLQQLTNPPPLSALFRFVRNEVYRASSERQTPYIHDQVIGEFWFRPNQAQSAASPPPSVLKAEALLEDGMQLLHERRCAAALEKFELAVRSSPENPHAHNAAGLACVCQGFLPQAVVRFGKAIGLLPTLAGAYYNRGNVYLATGRYELALDDFTWAIDEQPKNSDYHTRRGRGYFGLRKYEEALADLNLAVELDPGNAKAFHVRGQVHGRLGEYALAVADFRSALQRQSNFAEATEDLEIAERRVSGRF